MNLKNYLLIGTLLLNITGCVSGNSREDQLKIAEESIKRQDYQTAYSVLQPLAENGDPISQFNLGLLYYNGAGKDKRDFSHAREWFEKAASQGHLQSQKLLGLIYMKGEGVLQDLDQAKAWLEKAAAKNDQEAKYVLQQLENGIKPLEDD